MLPGPITDYPVLMVLIFAIGATVGSFLNVCIFRLPEAESIVAPPSRCGSCGRRLRFLDLIPILSALIFRFRCRYCGHAYSWQYPFVEALTGTLFLASVIVFGPSLEAAVTIVVSCSLIVIFFIDLRYLIIPDGLNAIILVCGLVLDVHLLATHGWRQGAVRFQEVFSGPLGAPPVSVDALTGAIHWVYLPRSVVGILVGAGLFLLISWAAGKIFQREAMGGGDVKLAGAMGAVLGGGYLFFTYALISIVLGAVVGVLLIALRIRSRRGQIPFGPMMAVAGILMLFWKDPIASFVARLYHLP
ncbi:MAG: prepilin peptidase [Armatimonadetes bacterium]|nr:prepilin peptidase [Armatimonadota bacterium]